MDGLVTNASLIVGVGGGGLSSHSIVLTGLAGLAAGSFSMAAGEYVSVSSQNELTGAEAEVEREKLARFPEAEEEELTEVLTGYGLDLDLAGRVAAEISKRPEAALRMHTREEFGVNPEDLASPWVAAGSSMVSFAAGCGYPASPVSRRSPKPPDLGAGVRGRPFRWRRYGRASHPPAPGAQWPASARPRGGRGGCHLRDRSGDRRVNTMTGMAERPVAAGRGGGDQWPQRYRIAAVRVPSWSWRHPLGRLGHGERRGSDLR